MDIFKETLKTFIVNIIKEEKKIDVSMPQAEKLIKNPPDDSFGDYCLAAYYMQNYGFKGKTETAAGDLYNLCSLQFAEIADLFDKIEIKGAYLNFFVKRERFVSEVVKEVVDSGSDYGRDVPEKPLTVVIDYSSPNIAKPFGVGHLRSTVIGMSLSKIYEFCGHKVIKINYLGDFGTQFGKLITAFCRYGDINFSEFEKDPVKVLYGLYVRIHKDEQTDATVEEEAKNRFKTLEDFMSANKRSFEEYLGAAKGLGDKKTKNTDNGSTAETDAFTVTDADAAYISKSIKLSEENKNLFCGTAEGQYNLWKIFRKLSIEEFKRIYKSIGIEFDSYEGEAESAEFSKDIKEILLESGIAEISEGAAIVNVKGIKAPALIAKSDGTSLYLSRDIVTAVSRMAKYNFDKMIYVVGSEQALHFSQLFGIFGILKEDAEKIKDGRNFKRYASMIDGKLIHVKFGRIIGMSTRKGNLVFLEDYIEEARLKALEKLEERLEIKDAAKKLSEGIEGLETLTENFEQQSLIPEQKKELSESEKDQIYLTSLKVGIGAVIFNDLKTRRTTDVNFSWDNVLSFEGQTGPYLQYTVSRINSLLSRLNVNETDLKNDAQSFRFSKNDADFDDIFLIAKQIYGLKTAVHSAVEQNEPSVLSSFALELASYFNKYYQNHRLIGRERDYIKPRIAMLISVNTVLVSILNLLCIPVLEKM
ncbi:MAG: arginine--tRNA ligase [Candidatus Acidulodesulfobacterium sp.]